MDGPSWDLKIAYQDFSDPNLQDDIDFIEKTVVQLRENTSFFNRCLLEVNDLKYTKDTEVKFISQYKLWQAAQVKLWDISVWCKCILSEDSSIELAQRLDGKVDEISSRLSELMNSFNLILKLSNQEFFESLNKSKEFCSSSFIFKEDRKTAKYALSLVEENLLTACEVNGPLALAKLWTSMSSSMSAHVDGKSLGLAEASGMLKSSHSGLRKLAYEGLQAAWDDKKEVCTSILNGLAGWRLSVNKRRSLSNPKHFLFDTLHQARLDRSTLDTMHHIIDERKDIGRKALRLQAKVLNKERLDPWDLLGGYPRLDSKESISWTSGLKTVSQAFGQVSDEMKSFVEMMAERNLIEATSGKRSKRLGAYCTSFLKSRTPLVFMTWQGSGGDLSTLAHELGHAWHTWAMRDLPIEESRYPSTLAETASIFSETLVADSLLRQANSNSSKLAIHWDRAESAGSFLLNIPARFRFEDSFMKARSNGLLTTGEIIELNASAWRESYADTLSSYDPLFWASKLHFYMWGRSFYNYPYTFGYLFALGVYATYLKEPTGFSKRYTELLRDTGKMSCEDLALKHLKVDIRTPKFWHLSLDIVERQMEEFESALASK